MSTGLDVSVIAQTDNRQARQSVRLLRGIFIILIIAAMYFARDFLLPVVLACFIALTFRPAIKYLSRHNVPAWFAAACFMGVFIATFVGAVYLLAAPIANWIDQAPALSRTFAEKFRGLRESLGALLDLTQKLENVTETTGQAAPQEVVIRESPLPTIMNVAGYPLQLVITTLATLVIAVFVMASGDLFYEKLVRVLPTLTDKKKALRIVYDMEHEVSSYLLTLTAINAGLGIIVAVTFHFLGMPSAHLWGLLTFLFNFIPYVGPLSLTALSSFMAIVTFDSISYALLVPVAFSGWSLLESEIVKPQILGRRLQLNSVVILLSLAFWSWMWGIAGAAIAVPVLLTIKVFCEHIDGLARLGAFLSGGHTEDVAADPADANVSS